MQPIINKPILRIFQFEDALINNLERWGVIPTTFDKFLGCNLALEHENMQVLVGATWNEDGTLKEYTRGNITASVTAFAQGFHVRRNQTTNNVWTEDTHNAAGNLIKSSVHVLNEGASESISEISFVGTYRDNEILEKEVIFTLELENKQSVEEPVFEINVMGTSVTDYQFDKNTGKCIGHQTDNSDSTKYNFDQSTGLIKNIVSTYSLGGGTDETVTEEINFEYDASNNIVKSEKLIDGSVSDATEFMNSYDNDGRLTAITLVPDDLIVLSLTGYYNLA